MELPYKPTTSRLSDGDKVCVFGWFFHELLGEPALTAPACCGQTPEGLLRNKGIVVPDEVATDMRIIYQTNDVSLFEDAFRMMLTFINKHRNWFKSLLGSGITRLNQIEVTIRRALDENSPEAAEGKALALEFSEEAKKRLGMNLYRKDVRAIDEFDIKPVFSRPWIEPERERGVRRQPDWMYDQMRIDPRTFEHEYPALEPDYKPVESLRDEIRKLMILRDYMRNETPIDETLIEHFIQYAARDLEKRARRRELTRIEPPRLKREKALR